MLYRKSVLAVLLGLIFLSFFGTLGVSASMFPENYDWRYRVISNLLSPRDNPDHYWLPACGVSLAALLMLPLAGYLRRHLKIASPRAALVSSGAFVAGIVALICTCLVVPQHVDAVLGIRRLHEFLGRSSAGFMAMGMLFGCWCAWKGCEWGLFWTWSLATLLPLVGLFCSECLLLLTRLEPSWATPIRSALRHSVLWHLGFWEWTGAAAVFVFLCAAVFLTPPHAASPTGVPCRRR
jgi:vacuolar-type H+-ATPase subunit I/STV1